MSVQSIPCQITGNIALCCDNKVLFFEFRAIATDRHEYIDLLEIPFHVELSFQPVALHFCEGVISCWDATALNIFKIQRVGDSQSISVSFSSELASISAEKPNTQSGGSQWSTRDAIDFRQVAEQKMLNQSVFRVNMMSDADDFGQCDLKPTDVNNMMVMLRGNGSGDCDLMTKYTIKSLLQLKSRRRRGFSDSFQSVSMRPIYRGKDQNSFNGHLDSFGGNIFQSVHSPSLASISVAVATQQDAYLYHFSGGSALDEWRHQTGNHGGDNGGGALVANYSFTSPVIDLVIDSAVLHALTETGIETYTLRTGHRIFYDGHSGNEEEILRPTGADEPICLIGIRPVLASKRIFCSGTNVVVLIGSDRDLCSADGAMDDGQFMVQSLRKPEMNVIYKNIDEFATRFRFDNPRLFVHLMYEAHVMVRLVSEMSHTIPVDELNRQNLRSTPLITFNSNPDPQLMSIFTESCCSLADYFVMQLTEEEYYMALPFYLMGQLGVNEIFNRLIQFEKNQTQSMAGVVYTLKRLFLRLQPDEAHATSLANPLASSGQSSMQTASITADAISYRLEKGNIIRILYDLLLKHSPSDVAVIALQSQLFANRSGERIYEFLEKKCERTHEETLCLALQLIRKNSPEAARQLIEEFDGRTLIHCLIKHWPILFETSTNHQNGSSIVVFSEFMELCLLCSSLSTIQIVTANVLKYLLVNLQVLPFDVLLKLLIDYSALQIGCAADGTGRKILLITLELYLIEYYAQKRMPRVATRNSMETSLESAMHGGGVGSSGVDLQCSDISIRTAESSKANESSILTDIDSGLSIFGPVATGKALKILVRSYLGQLKGFSMHQNYNPDELGRVNGEPKNTEEFEQLEQEINALFEMQKRKPADCQVELLKRLCGNEMNLNSSELTSNHLLRPILFLDSRLNYLNYMPPLQDNFLDTFLKPKEDLSGSTGGHEANISCVKIQALLCSENVPMDVANEISQFVYTNPHLIGIEGIISCLLPTRESAELLSNVCPQAVLEFAKERVHTEDDWRFLIQCLQRQTNKDTTESNGGMQLFYHRLLKGECCC